MQHSSTSSHTDCAAPSSPGRARSRPPKHRRQAQILADTFKQIQDYATRPWPRAGGSSDTRCSSGNACPD